MFPTTATFLAKAVMTSVADAVFVTNEQFAQQEALIRSTDLALQFELREPGKPGTFLVFG